MRGTDSTHDVLLTLEECHRDRCRQFKGKRYLIHDRDTLFTNEFRDILLGAGVECIKLPAQSPDLNAYAERCVGLENQLITKLATPANDNTTIVRRERRSVVVLHDDHRIWLALS